MSTHARQGATSPEIRDRTIRAVDPALAKGPAPPVAAFVAPGIALSRVIARARTQEPPPRKPGAGPTWAEWYYAGIERDRARSLAAHMDNEQRQGPVSRFP